MKSRLSLVLSFTSGAMLSGIAVVTWMLHWTHQQSQLQWSTHLHQVANDALKLSRGDHDEALRSMEERLPGLVLSVHSFGENEGTRGALHRAKEFYLQRGKPMPPEIQAILSSPRL